MEYYWNRTEGWLTILTSCQQHPVMSWTWTRHWQHMCRLDSITSQCHETTVDFLKIGMSWKWKSYIETKITPENWWLEDDPFLLGCHLFRGELCVSLEGNQHSTQELAALQVSEVDAIDKAGRLPVTKGDNKSRDKSMREKWWSHVPASPWLNWRVKLEPLISNPIWDTSDLLLKVCLSQRLLRIILAFQGLF